MTVCPGERLACLFAGLGHPRKLGQRGQWVGGAHGAAIVNCTTDADDTAVLIVEAGAPSPVDYSTLDGYIRHFDVVVPPDAVAH